MISNYDYDIFCGMYKMPLDGEWPNSVIAYHITHRSNLGSILKNGIQAKESQATWTWDRHPRAVYLFAARQDAYDAKLRQFLFSDADDLAVIKVNIPQSHYQYLLKDGLFNISAVCSDGSYPYGMQYLNDIPSGWISKDSY